MKSNTIPMSGMLLNSLEPNKVSFFNFFYRKNGHSKVVLKNSDAPFKIDRILNPHSMDKAEQLNQDLINLLKSSDTTFFQENVITKCLDFEIICLKKFFTSEDIIGSLLSQFIKIIIYKNIEISCQCAIRISQCILHLYNEHFQLKPILQIIQTFINSPTAAGIYSIGYLIEFMGKQISNGFQQIFKFLFSSSASSFKPAVLYCLSHCFSVVDDDMSKHYLNSALKLLKSTFSSQGSTEMEQAFALKLAHSLAQKRIVSSNQLMPIIKSIFDLPILPTDFILAESANIVAEITYSCLSELSTLSEEDTDNFSDSESESENDDDRYLNSDRNPDNHLPSKDDINILKTSLKSLLIPGFSNITIRSFLSLLDQNFLCYYYKPIHEFILENTKDRSLLSYFTSRLPNSIKETLFNEQSSVKSDESVGINQLLQLYPLSTSYESLSEAGAIATQLIIKNNSNCLSSASRFFAELCHVNSELAIRFFKNSIFYFSSTIETDYSKCRGMAVCASIILLNLDQNTADNLISVHKADLINFIITSLRPFSLIKLQDTSTNNSKDSKNGLLYDDDNKEIPKFHDYPFICSMLLLAAIPVFAIADGVASIIISTLDNFSKFLQIFSIKEKDLKDKHRMKRLQFLAQSVLMFISNHPTISSANDQINSDYRKTAIDVIRSIVSHEELTSDENIYFEYKSLITIDPNHLVLNSENLKDLMIDIKNVIYKRSPDKEYIYSRLTNQMLPRAWMNSSFTIPKSPRFTIHLSHLEVFIVEDFPNFINAIPIESATELVHKIIERKKNRTMMHLLLLSLISSSNQTISQIVPSDYYFHVFRFLKEITDTPRVQLACELVGKLCIKHPEILGKLFTEILIQSTEIPTKALIFLFSGLALTRLDNSMIKSIYVHLKSFTTKKETISEALYALSVYYTSFSLQLAELVPIQDQISHFISIMLSPLSLRPYSLYFITKSISSFLAVIGPLTPSFNSISSLPKIINCNDQSTANDQIVNNDQNSGLDSNEAKIMNLLRVLIESLKNTPISYHDEMIMMITKAICTFARRFLGCLTIKLQNGFSLIGRNKEIQISTLDAYTDLLNTHAISFDQLISFQDKNQSLLFSSFLVLQLTDSPKVENFILTLVNNFNHNNSNDYNMLVEWIVLIKEIVIDQILPDNSKKPVGSTLILKKTAINIASSLLPIISKFYNLSLIPNLNNALPLLNNTTNFQFNSFFQSIFQPSQNNSEKEKENHEEEENNINNNEEDEDEESNINNINNNNINNNNNNNKVNIKNNKENIDPNKILDILSDVFSEVAFLNCEKINEVLYPVLTKYIQKFPIISKKLIDNIKRVNFNLSKSSQFLQTLILSSQKLNDKALFDQISQYVINILRLEHSVNEEYLTTASILIYVSYHFNELETDNFKTFLIPKVYPFFSELLNVAIQSLNKVYIINQTTPNAQTFKAKYSKTFSKLCYASIILTQNELTLISSSNNSNNTENPNGNDENSNENDKNSNENTENTENLIENNRNDGIEESKSFSHFKKMEKIKEFFTDELDVATDTWRIETAYVALALLYNNQNTQNNNDDSSQLVEAKEILQSVIDVKKFSPNLSVFLSSFIPKFQGETEWLEMCNLVSNSFGFSKESVVALLSPLQNYNISSIQGLNEKLITLIKLTINLMNEKNAALSNDEYIEILHSIEKITK